MSSPSPQRPGLTPKSGSSRHHHGNDHHQHSKSWTARLYRKHDAKHHRPESAPLLADDNPEPSEITSEPEDEHQPTRDCCSSIIKGPILLVKKAGGLLKKAATSAGKATKSVGHVVANAGKKTTSFVRNNPKKVMAGTIAGLTVATVGLSTKLALHQIQHKDAVDVCTTPACVQASDFILRNLDPGLTADASTHALEFGTASINPCTEFDQFVCGGFRKRYDLREDQGDMYTGSLVADEVDSFLKRVVVQDKIKVPSDALPIHNTLKKAFDACMNKDEAQKTGLEPLKALVDHVKGLMPTTSLGREGARRLKQTAITLGHVNGIDEALTFLKQLGIDALIRMDVIPDQKEPDQQVVAVSPVLAIGLPAPHFYRNAGLVTKYREIATKVLGVFYDVHLNSTSILRRHQKIHTNVLELAQGVVDLEVKLALALPMTQELGDLEKTYNKLGIDGFRSLLPQIDIGAIIKELAPGYQPDVVLATSPKYLERLSYVLEGTPIEILQAFLSWKVIQTLGTEVDDLRLMPLKEFDAELQGAVQQQPAEPWRRCVREVNEILGWTMSYFFVQQKLPDSTALASDVVAGQVKESLAGMLDAAEWMTDEDRKQAVQKALAISHQVGSPNVSPNVHKPSSIEKFYSTLNITNSHFANKIEFAKFEARRIWSKLTKPTDQDQWHLYPTAVNAYYDHSANRVVLPAALLQAPLQFDNTVPGFLSYGSIGSIAGHEMAHAFGPVGSLIDKGGKLGDWWSNETRVTFKEKAQCFAEQYSAFNVEGPEKEYTVNGNLTMSENIADTVGVQAAYLAWQTASKDESSQALPGLEKFTRDQLFWIAYGNRWCSKTTPEKAAARVTVDTHAPKPARILGAVANSKRFLEAFNCPSKKPTCDMF